MINITKTFNKPRTIAFISLLTLVLVFSLLSIQPVSAKEDFTAYAGSSIFSVCQCAHAEDYVVVKNTGTVASNYFIIPEGDAAGWHTFAYTSFILAPSQSASVLDYVNPGCNAPGTYSSRIKIMTGSGLVKYINQKVLISDCYDFKLTTPYKDYLAVCGYNIPIPLILENKGTQTQTFSFAANESVSSFNPTTISVKPGEKASVQAFVNVPCTNTGKKNILAAAFIQNTNIKRAVQFSVDVLLQDSAYKPLILPESVSVAYDDKLKQFTIRNIGRLTAKYNVYSAGVDWVSLNDYSVEVAPGEKKTFDVALSPSRDKNPAGTYKLTFYSQVASSVFVSTVNLSLDDSLLAKLSAFYYNSIAPYALFIWIVVGALVLLLIIIFFTKLVVKSSQKRLLDYMESGLYEERATILKVKTPLVHVLWHRLKKSEPRTAIVHNIDFDLTKIIITAKKHLSAASLKIEKLTELPEKHESMHAEFSDKPVKIYQIFKFSKKKLNDSAIEQAVILFRVEKAWLSKNKLSKKEISLYRLRSKMEKLKTVYKGSCGNYHYYEASVSGFSYFFIGDTQLQKKKEAHEKKKNEIKKEIKMAVRKKASKTLQKRSRKKKEFNFPALIAVLLLLFFLVIIAFVAYKGGTGNLITSVINPEQGGSLSPELQKNLSVSEQQINDRLTFIDANSLRNLFQFQVWNKNTKHVIDLGVHFNSLVPSGEVLRYGIRQPDNVTAILEGSKITLIPPQDWYGIDSLYVVASDSQNIVLTESITLIVQNYVPGPYNSFASSTKRAWDWFIKNITVITSLVIFVFVLVWLGLYLSKFTRKQIRRARRKKAGAGRAGRKRKKRSR